MYVCLVSLLFVLFVCFGVFFVGLFFCLIGMGFFVLLFHFDFVLFAKQTPEVET